MADKRRVRLKPLIEDGLRSFTNLYDFGDHWEHIVKVEDLVPPKPDRPLIACLAGENTCPPEAREHVALGRGSFDPAAFDLAEVNERLTAIKP